MHGGSDAHRLGDAALARLVGAHRLRLWRYLRHLGCPWDLADDLTQEAFAVLLRRPFEERGDAATAAFLQRTARNLLCNHRRKPEFVTEAWCEQVDAHWAVPSDDGSARLEALRACLAAVEGRPRQVLDGFYRDGMSREQLADRMGLAPSSVKSILRRAREALRACIARRLPRGASSPDRDVS